MEETDVLAELDDLKSQIEGIRSMEAHCSELDAKVTLCKAELKYAKEEYDAAVISLRNAIRQRDEELPLFDKKPQEPDAWRAVSVEELELPSAILRCFAEHKPKPITTLGDLAEFNERNPLTDINGIGEAKAEKIDKALVLYWQRNPIHREAEEEDEKQ